MITASMSALQKLNKNKAVANFIAMCPSISFNKASPGDFIGYYLFFKEELIRVARRSKLSFQLIFNVFEGDEGFTDASTIDEELLDEFLGIMLLTIKDSPGRSKLIVDMGYSSIPPALSLLEGIRSYHCGDRSIPFKFES